MAAGRMRELPGGNAHESEPESESLFRSFVCSTSGEGNVMIKKPQQSQKHLALNALALAAAATIGGVALTPSTAHATIKINEVMLNAPGTNSTQDFIELKSTTGGAEAFDLYMVMLEGDAGAAGGVGAVDTIVPLIGTTGPNGLFLRHSFSTGPNPAPHPDTVQQAATYGHENAAATWVLCVPI